MIQLLTSLFGHAVSLFIYPGLLTGLVLGAGLESLWVSVSGGSQSRLRLRRPTAVAVTVALSAALGAAQLAAPFNPTPPAERNLVIAAVALAFTLWAELALSVDVLARPGLLLLIQCCWLLSVLGPAVQPESLRPQVLGNVLVPGLLPLKVASGFLYLLCVPVLLRLWPLEASGERRRTARFDLTRGLCWFVYSALFATLFFTPQSDDLTGLVRFTVLALFGAAMIFGLGVLLERRGAPVAMALYRRAVPAYAAFVFLLVIFTSVMVH